MDTRQKMVNRAVKEIANGMNVNLGIGIPTLVANVIPADYDVLLQSENGLLGIGPYPVEEAVDPDLINAGRKRSLQFQEHPSLTVQNHLQ